MLRTIGPLFLLPIALCSQASFAQTSQQAPEKKLPGPDINAVTVQQQPQVAPPSDFATPEELEQTGDKLRAQKAFNDAVEYYQVALKKKPDSAVVHNKLGITYLQLNLLTDAAKEFQRSSKLDKAYPEPLNNIGVIEYIKKKYGKAIHDYEKALKLREDSASFHSNLGTAYFGKKEFDKAMTEYARAMQLDPDIFEHQSMAGVGLRLSSPEDRARYAYTMAKLCAERGMFDRSIRYLKKAIEGEYPGINDAYKEPAFDKLRQDPQFAGQFALVMQKKDTLTQ
ncbi:MAG: tetratricopeptide repeat protein [Acidobacteriaceae bacterium]|nr:tetratricopeptide repeat protein [Acidobacteriaceae bacterium]